MASAHISPTLPPETTLWRCASILALALISAACGLVDYSIGPSNLVSNQFSGSTSELGTIYFHYTDQAEPYAVHVNRTAKGYAINAPLYHDEDSGAHLTLSRTKDYQFFVGMQANYTF